mgnify:CR=1 FL=1
MTNLFINLIYIFLFCLGTIVGSFLLVVIFRSEKEEEVIRTPSHCTYCGAKLSWYELIPILSFVFLGGKCRHCHHRLSLWYPLMEILIGILFDLVFWRFLHLPFFQFALFSKNLTFIFLAVFSLLLWLIYTSVLTLIATYDLRNMVVLDSFLLVGLLTAFVGETSLYLVSYFTKIGFVEEFHQFLGGFNYLFPAVTFSGIWSNLIGMFCSWFFIFLIYKLSHGKAMGNGDPLIAAFIGWILGMPEALFFILLSFIIGGLYSIVLLVFRKKTIKQHIAFGPWLALAGFLIFLAGDILLQWYLNLLTVA